MVRRALTLLAALGLLLAFAVPVAARNINSMNAYKVTNLVSDTGVGGTLEDPLLVNAWGITAGPMTPWWVANNATSTSTLYGGSGAKFSIEVGVAGHPTGTVFNGSADFVVTSGAAHGPARFLFATEGGQILGWNPAVPPPAPAADAIVAATTAGAIYKGLAIGSVTSGGTTANYLYATDFHHARVDVSDGSFHPTTLTGGSFVDPGIPAGFAPFGIQNLGGTIYVTYAKQDADAVDEINGGGLGYVSAFGPDGSFIGRVASRGALNAPWGLAWAPSEPLGTHPFGKFSGDLLVGNFGNGRIHAYAPTDEGWEPRGVLKGTNHRPISIDGLWGIGFGNDAAAGSKNVLYFAAGPDDEAHGLFGSIAP